MQYYKQLQIFRWKDLHVYEIAKLMHKCTRTKLQNRCSSLFTRVRLKHTQNTCLAPSDLSWYLPKYRTNKLQRNFQYQGAKISI